MDQHGIKIRCCINGFRLRLKAARMMSRKKLSAAIGSLTDENERLRQQVADNKTEEIAVDSCITAWLLDKEELQTDLLRTRLNWHLLKELASRGLIEYRFDKDDKFQLIKGQAVIRVAPRRGDGLD